jgi:hypothetical protein
VTNDLSVADSHTLNAGGMTFVLTKSGTGASTRPFRSDAGGTPVKIDKEGKIVAGPDSLAGKKVDELGSGKKKDMPGIHDMKIESPGEQRRNQEAVGANKTSEPHQNPYTRKWHIRSKKTGDISDQSFDSVEECQEAIDAPEFRPKKIGDRIYVVDRYGDKHWRWPDKSYDTIEQAQLEIDEKMKKDRESAQKSAQARKDTQDSVPTFGSNGTHVFLDSGRAK